MSVAIDPARGGSEPDRRLGWTAGTMALVAATALAPMAWGTTYIVSTEMLPADRPLLAGLLRALPAGIALALIVRSLPAGAWWLKAAILGVLNIGGFFALLFYAAFLLPGGVAATLGAIQPLLAAGLAAALLAERLRRLVVLAGALGVVGVALLVLRADAGLDGLGVAAGLAGAASMAAGVVLTKHWGRPAPLLAFTSWQLVAGGLFLVPLTLAIEGVPSTLSATNLAGFAWLAIVGTAIAYALWFRGVQLLPVAQVSILGLLSPVVAALAGWFALGQGLSAGQLGGMALILAAVWLGQVGHARQPATARVNAARTEARPRHAWKCARVPLAVNVVGTGDGQKGLGVDASPMLVEPGDRGVLQAAARGSLLVIGLSDRCQQAGLGANRHTVTREADVPVLMVRRGLRPGGLARRHSLTRFT